MNNNISAGLVAAGSVYFVDEGEATAKTTEDRPPQYIAQSIPAMKSASVI